MWLSLALHKGLIDDDFSMELLVLGNIVALDLPVRLVFLSLWQPVQSIAQSVPVGPAGLIGPPMRITYRLQVRFALSAYCNKASCPSRSQCRAARRARLWTLQGSLDLP